MLTNWKMFPQAILIVSCCTAFLCAVGFFFIFIERQFTLLLSQILERLQCCRLTHRCQEALRRSEALRGGSFSIWPFLYHHEGPDLLPLQLCVQAPVDCSAKWCFEQIFLHLPLANTTWNSAVSHWCQWGLLLCVRCCLGWFVTGSILLGLRLVLVDLSGKYGFPFIPWALDDICSYCQLGKERYVPPSLSLFLSVLQTSRKPPPQQRHSGAREAPLCSGSWDGTVNTFLVQWL